MAETSYPWNGTTTGDATTAPYDANTEWADVQSSFGYGTMRNNSGVVFGSGSETSPLEGLEVTANSPAAANVLINVGRAFVNGTIYKNTSIITQAIAANASGNPRIDTIILRKSFAAQTVRVAILQGTPAATPAAPSLTQTAGVTWEIPLADIAVANGFVSITAANITQRALPVNTSDSVLLDRMYNASGAARQTGDVVTLNISPADPGRGQAQTPTSSNINGGAVWVGATPSTSLGRVQTRGVGLIKASSASGRYCNAAAGSNQPTQTAMKLINSFAFLLPTVIVANAIQPAYIESNLLGQEYGQIAASNLLAAPAAAIALTGLNNPFSNATYVIELFLRSAVVAISDTVNLRFGGTGALDTTAANYYSYQSNISTAAPVVSAVQNLGAAAGIQFTIAGSTAPANNFSHIIIDVGNAYPGGFNKTMSGVGCLFAGTTNGTIAVLTIAGRWVDTTNSLNQLSLVSNGGSNLATGSYINVYAKQVT